jgi:hypothetical protein
MDVGADVSATNMLANETSFATRKNGAPFLLSSKLPEGILGFSKL